MPLISKPNTFNVATVISSSQVNENFDELYDALNGTDTDKTIVIKSGDGSTPLTLDQTSANNTQEWHDTGVVKARMLKSGVFESLVATGTAPFTVASTTKVDNLNADMIDGLSSSDLVSITSGVLEIDAEIPTLRFTDTTHTDFDLRTKVIGGVDALTVLERTGSTDIFSVDRNGLVLVLDQVRVISSAPVAAGDLTRKDYVDGRKVPFAIGGFFPGAASTSAPRPSFIVPPNVVDATITQMKVVYQGGTNTGTSTVQWIHNGSGKNQTSITTEAANTVITNNITDVVVAANDVIYFRINAAGNHADITVELVGEMKGF